MAKLMGQQRNLLLALHNFGHGKDIMRKRRQNYAEALTSKAIFKPDRSILTQQNKGFEFF